MIYLNTYKLIRKMIGREPSENEMIEVRKAIAIDQDNNTTKRRLNSEGNINPTAQRRRA